MKPNWHPRCNAKGREVRDSCLCTPHLDRLQELNGLSVLAHLRQDAPGVEAQAIHGGRRPEHRTFLLTGGRAGLEYTTGLPDQPLHSTS